MPVLKVISIVANRTYRLVISGVFIFLLIFFCRHHLKAQTASATRNQVEAIFLYNFTQFVEWPPSAFPAGDAPFIIGIFGRNPFSSYLEEAIRNEMMNGHHIVIQQYKSLDSIRNCHMLFIGSKEEKQVRAIVTSLKGNSILTVSNNKRFATLGGMIRFFNVKNKIKFQVNLSAVKKANLSISSKLLRLAYIANTDNP